MKLRLLVASLLIALIACPFVRADDGAPTPLEKDMKILGKAFRQLKKQAGDSAQNSSSLALVAQMQKAAADSVALIPAKAADLPEKDRAAFIADYKVKMQQFGDALTKLETALKAGDNAAATKLVADLNALERSGHKAFRKPQN